MKYFFGVSILIYLDNAATTGKKPQSVVLATYNALKNFSANPGRSGHNLSLKAAEQVYKCREKLAEFFGAENLENVIFTQNCTMSINMVLKGVLQKGDHIIVSSLEHNALMRPLNMLKHYEYIDYDIAEVFFDDAEATYRSFERLVRPNTKMIFCTHASNVLGIILPIKKIGLLCKQRKILFAVDAAQTAGVIPINMIENNINYLCVAPHKGLYAPMGIGVLICNGKINKTIIEGGTGTDSNNMLQPANMPEQLESGTLNVPGIFGVLAGVDFVKRYDIKKLYHHEMRLIQYAYEELSNIKGVDLYVPYPSINQFAPVLSFNVRGISSDVVSEFLNKNNIAVRAGLHCAPSAHNRIGTSQTGTVRISTAYFNTHQDISTLIRAVSLIKKSNKILKTY